MILDKKVILLSNTRISTRGPFKKINPFKNGIASFNTRRKISYSLIVKTLRPGVSGSIQLIIRCRLW
jgi:hypothetical protein